MNPGSFEFFSYFFILCYPLTLRYWVLSFVKFSTFLYVGFSRSHITGLRFFYGFFYSFLFHHLKLYYWTLNFMSFFHFSFYRVILGRRFVKLTRADFGFFRYSFYFTWVFIFLPRSHFAGCKLVKWTSADSICFLHLFF
jgi:hypothetical protein